MSTNQHITTNDFVNDLSTSYSFTKVSNLWYISAVDDWVCKKISLESASEQLSAIMISLQQVLPNNPDACANVTTCWWVLQTYEAKHVIFGNICYQNPSRGMKSLEMLFCGDETQIWLDSRLTKCFAHGLWLTSARIWLMKMTKLTVFIALSLQCFCYLCVLRPWHIKICKDGK